MVGKQNGIIQTVSYFYSRALVHDIRHDLRRCFELHTNLMSHVEMLPGLTIDATGS